MLSRLPSRLLMLTLLLFGGGCAVDGEESTNEILATGTAPIAAADWEQRFAMIEGLLGEEEWLPALQLIDATWTEDMPPIYAGQLGLLEFRAKRGYVENDCLEASIVLDADRYEIGDVIDGEVVLKNTSSEDIVIPAIQEVAEPDGAGTVATKTVFSRTVTYREFLADDTIVTQTDTRNLIVDEDIRLDPGESFRVPVALDTAVNNLSGTMLRRYEFGCSLRAARIEVGTRSFEGELGFRIARADVFPLGAEHLRREPLDRVNEAIVKRSYIHLPLATASVRSEQREELLRILESALRASPTESDLTRALMSSLSVAAGDDRRRERGEWLDWLRRRAR